MEQLSLRDWVIRFFFFLLSVFMINRLFFFSPGVAEMTTSYLLYPIIKTQKFFIDPLCAYTKRKADIHFLQQEVAQLKDINQDLQAQIIQLHSILDFQNASEEVRQFAQKYDFSSQKIAQVLMRSFDEHGHFFWVDAGSEQGITVNMIVIYKNNIVGRVIHVDPWYSKVALITDKRCKIAATCQKTKTVGIYEGHNNFEPTLEFVPHYNDLQIGDCVVSTGQGLVYPQGFALGKIKNFYVQDVAYKVIVENLVDLHTIKYVYVIAV